MTERVRQELALLRGWWSSLEFVEAGLWVLLDGYQLPPAIWDRRTADVALQIPSQLPAQAPYGFYVFPHLQLNSGGAIGSYTYPAHEPPFARGPWGRFSWALTDWAPASDVLRGSNVVQFARSIADRLREGA